MKTIHPRFWARMAGLAGCLGVMLLQADTFSILSLRTLLAKAENNDAEAQYQLGHRFDKGLGAPRNAAEAIRWYEAAARLGHSEAQFALGHLYTTGAGVKRDYLKAYMWLNISASGGHQKAGNRRDILALWMGTEHVAMAEELALQLFINQHDLHKEFRTPAPGQPVPTPSNPPTTPAPSPATPEPAPEPPLP